MSKTPRSELAAALAACRGAFAGVGVFTALVNILMLTGSFFMLLVYDRVLPSRSVPTLIGLSILALALFAFMGLLDFIRNRILLRIGSALDEALNARVFDAVVRLPLKRGISGDGLQHLRDLDQLRGFLGSPGPSALFDLPWMPLYLFICFLFHFWIGIAATVGGLVLISLTLLTEFKTREPGKQTVTHAIERNTIALASRRNAEVLQAMGMARNIAAVFDRANEKYIESQTRTSDVAGGLGAISKVFRMTLQSGVLGLGAYLAINDQASAGIIIASSILTSRALAPVELAIANWKGFLASRQSWARLTELLRLMPERDEPMALPAPVDNFAADNVSIVAPGSNKLIVQDATFRLKKGQALAIIGPSASGKSSLARALVGVWQPARGKVRLDGAAIEQWSSEALGRHLGYVPQHVELFAGTIAQNIARFNPDAKPEAIVAAAKAAECHELVLRLPDGFETQIGEGGTVLSAGQHQRIALASALYGDPFLVVLDEPNSNLDSEGEEALRKAILSVRARGGVVVVVAHRPSVLAAVDLVMVMAEGRVQAFGPKDEVLKKVLRPPQQVPPPGAAPVPATAALSLAERPGARS